MSWQTGFEPWWQPSYSSQLVFLVPKSRWFQQHSLRPSQHSQEVLQTPHAIVETTCIPLDISSRRVTPDVYQGLMSSTGLGFPTSVDQECVESWKWIQMDEPKTHHSFKGSFFYEQITNRGMSIYYAYKKMVLKATSYIHLLIHSTAAY